MSFSCNWAQRYWRRPYNFYSVWHKCKPDKKFGFDYSHQICTLVLGALSHCLSHKKKRQDAQYSPFLPTMFPLASTGFCTLCYTIIPHRSHISHLLGIISKEAFSMVWGKYPNGETISQESDILFIFSMATNHNARNMWRARIWWFFSWRPIWFQEIWSNTFVSFSDCLYILPQLFQKLHLSPALQSQFFLMFPRAAQDAHTYF